jgi:predicted transcriptional regulator
MSSESSYSIIYRKIAGKSRFDTITNILSAVKIGAGKTRIMNTLNLNCDQLEVYLSLLLEIELLNSDLTNKNNFIITVKGQQFLRDYNNLKIILK